MNMMKLILSELSIWGRDYNVDIVEILVHRVSLRHSGQVWCTDDMSQLQNVMLTGRGIKDRQRIVQVLRIWVRFAPVQAAIVSPLDVVVVAVQLLNNLRTTVCVCVRVCWTERQTDTLYQISVTACDINQHSADNVRLVWNQWMLPFV